MEPLNVGIIGFGRIGREHADWIRASGVAIPIAVADPTPACRTLAESVGLRTHETIDAMLARPDVDAVLVASPTRFHAEHALAALAAGKHVMIEKPMALDHDSAATILADAGDRVVSVFHNRRWDADYLAVRAAVNAGVLGRVLNVESRLGQWGSCVGPAAREWHPGWRNEAAFGGGGWFDWGSHFVDQLWQLLSPAKPVRVFAQMRGNVWTQDCDDLARVSIDFDNGCIAMVEINTTTTRPLPRWHFDGTRGSINAPFSPTFDTHQWAKLEFTPAAPASRSLRYSEEPDSTVKSGSSEYLRDRLAGIRMESLSEADIWARFAAAVRGEGEPAVPALSVLPTMRLLDAARLSSQTGEVVQIRDWP